MSETLEELARKAAKAWYDSADAPWRTDPLYAYELGFLAGSAASTRAAVIAELEGAIKTVCPYCRDGWGLYMGTHYDTVRGPDGGPEMDQVCWCAADSIHSRIAQLRAEQGNEQTGEGA